MPSLSTLENNDNNLFDLTKPILTATLLLGNNSFDINTNINILSASVNLVNLLKDLTNRFFNESSIVIEVIGRVLPFFYERYFKCKKHKQKHLSNIQPNISTSKKASK